MSEAARLRFLMVLVGLFMGAVVPASAKKGDIVPEPHKGIEIRTTDAGSVATVKTSVFRLEVMLASHHGVLSLRVKIQNNSDEPLKIAPESVQLESAGSAVDPLAPGQYAALVSDAKPYRVDKDNHILTSVADEPEDDDKKKDDPSANKKNAWHKSRGTPEARMALTKDLMALKTDLLTFGGAIPPGATAKGRHEYQRNGLDLPLVVKFQPAGSEETTTVKFIRSR